MKLLLLALIAYLTKKGIIRINLKGNKLCSRFWKSTNKNTIYLGIAKYWIE